MAEVWLATWWGYEEHGIIAVCGSEGTARTRAESAYRAAMREYAEVWRDPPGERPEEVATAETALIAPITWEASLKAEANDVDAIIDSANNPSPFLRWFAVRRWDVEP